MPTLKKDHETETVQDLYRKLGYRVRTKPDGEAPRLPTSIHAMKGNAFADLQIQYAAWREYTEDLHIEAAAEYAQQKVEYDLMVAKLMITAVGKTAKDRSNSVITQPQVKMARMALLRCETLVDMLVGRLDSYTNALTVLSREVTRRSNFA